MAGFTDTVETAILNHLFGKSTWTPPATMYLLVSSTAITDAGTGATEPTTGGYARVATTGSHWRAPTGTAPVVITNASVLSFPKATAGWLAGTQVAYFALSSAATGGTFQVTGSLAVGKAIETDDTLEFPPDSLAIRLGDPGDSGL